MIERHLQPPRIPTPPVRRQLITLQGKVVYDVGMWGRNRPARKVKVSLLTNDTAAHAVPTGSLLELETSETDISGRFSFTIAQYSFSNLFLEFKTPQGRIFRKPLKDHIRPQSSYSVSINPYAYQTWSVRLPFGPPMPDLMTVNGLSVSSLEFGLGLLRGLARKPVYPLTIKLLKENDDDGIDNYTPAQELFRGLERRLLPGAFPDLVAGELGKLPMLQQTKPTDTAGFLQNALERFSLLLSVEELIHGTLLEPVLDRLATATGGYAPSDMVRDPIIDWAAASTMVFVAALIARDNAKPEAVFGTQVFPQMPDSKFLTVNIFIFLY